MNDTTDGSQEVTGLELEVIDEAAAAQVSGGWWITSTAGVTASWPIMD